MDLRVYRENAAAGAVNFFVDNKLRRDFHIVVHFSMMTGYVCNCQLPYGRNISKGRTLIFTLRPRESVGSQNYQFSWSYYSGHVTRKIADVDYLMPIAPDKKAEVMSLQTLSSFVGKEDKENDDYYSIGFKVEKDAVIHAIRRGRVIKIVDNVDTKSQKTDLNFSSAMNYMIIRHEDASETRYSILKKGGFKVDELDFVEAGDPIAVAAGDNYASGPQIHLRTSYIAWNKNKKRDEAYQIHYIPTRFASVGGQASLLNPRQEYTSVYSEDLIVQEMSRKEIKNRAKGKKKK